MTDKPRLARQSYGIACAQVTFGGPRGIWLECRTCSESQVIVGSKDNQRWWEATDAECAEVFRSHGWTGEGDRMIKAHCPKCSKGEHK